MNNNEINIARNLISKIDRGELEYFDEYVNTENEIACKLFKDSTNKIIGIFFSCIRNNESKKEVRISISFEFDINNEDINKSLWELILFTHQNRHDVLNNFIEIIIRNENRHIIKYLETKCGNEETYEKYNNPAQVWSPYTRYAGFEYTMYRENFTEEFVKSKPRMKDVIIKPHEAKKENDYLRMLDKAWIFSPNDYLSRIVEDLPEEPDKPVKTEDNDDDDGFEAFWDKKTGTLIGLYRFYGNNIAEIAVSPDYQGKGYGSFILTRAIKRIFKIDPKTEKATLDCVDWNKQGQAFYKKYGMEATAHCYSLPLNTEECTW